MLTGNGESTAMKNETTRALFLYWDRLRNGRPAPRRTEIEPSDIRTLLADTFVLEANHSGAAKFRLAGTRLCGVFGRELKGFEIDHLFNDRDRRLVGGIVQSTIRESTVSVIGLSGQSKNGRHIALELVLMPLAYDSDGARILGSISCHDRPFWLGADPVLRCGVTSLRIVDPDREPMFLKNRPAIEVPTLVPDLTGTDAALPDFIDSGQPSHKVGHLRVFDGGRPSAK
jgi:hypothetical protein